MVTNLFVCYRTIVSVGRQLRGSINLSSVFSDGDILKRKGVFDAIMKGLTEQAVEAVDNNFATDVRVSFKRRALV